MTIQTNEEIPTKKMGLLDAYATEDEIKKNTKLFLDPTKIDISLVQPGFKALTDKAIANKILDREWVLETAQKADQLNSFSLWRNIL